jgi:16S rRNA A1518/A1519 N6-dimethyltransferase RsmA/KsgA/DIM1 with predicted DNA glycosylase/AP lyase activity
VSELVVVEIDRDLAAHLSTTLGAGVPATNRVAHGHAIEGARGDPWNTAGVPATNRVRVVTADVLTIDLASLVEREQLPARVVGQPSLQHLRANPVQAVRRVSRRCRAA